MLASVYVTYHGSGLCDVLIYGDGNSSNDIVVSTDSGYVTVYDHWSLHKSLALWRFDGRQRQGRAGQLAKFIDAVRLHNFEHR
jgi:hypothetical protein